MQGAHEVTELDIHIKVSEANGSIIYINISYVEDLYDIDIYIYVMCVYMIEYLHYIDVYVYMYICIYIAPRCSMRMMATSLSG
eukprot:COSAG06_NODE_253_length_19061_cov_33.083114_6_plen_83_part_00